MTRRPTRGTAPRNARSTRSTSASPRSASTKRFSAQAPQISTGLEPGRGRSAGGRSNAGRSVSERMDTERTNTRGMSGRNNNEAPQSRRSGTSASSKSSGKLPPKKQVPSPASNLATAANTLPKAPPQVPNFAPAFPASFASVENERLYLTNDQPALTLGGQGLDNAKPGQANLKQANLKQAGLEQTLLEQALLTFLSNDVAKKAFFGKDEEQTQELTLSGGQFSLPTRLPTVLPTRLPTRGSAESSDFTTDSEVESHTPAKRLLTQKSLVQKSAGKSVRRTPLDEPEDVRSPFGDIIETMHEVLTARNGGRYMPAPKSAEKPRPPGVELHQAIGFKLYAPNPHKSRSAEIAQSANGKRRRDYPQRHEKVYPAAVPPDAVFAVMPPETKTYHAKLAKVLRSEGELPEGSEIVVAVSGGVDSIVLLDMLMCLAQKQSLSVSVVHFNHRLRGQESDHDANFVRESCKRYNVPCYVAWADVERFAEVQSMSLEQAGRELRYKFLEFVAYKRRADAVLTAHTLNDSVETVLMNLLRGSGLAGLAGIPQQRAFGEHTKLFRPLLGMKKPEIQDYALLRGLSWREDSTNTQSVFRRNKIRNELLPLLESEYSSGIVEVLHRTSQIISGADDLIRDSAERLLPSLVVEEEMQPFIGLNIAGLRVHKRFMQGELVRRAVQRRFGLALSFDALDRILALLDAEVGTKTDVMRGFMAVRDRMTILLGIAPAVHNLNVRVEKNNHYDFGGWRIFLEEIDRKNVKFTADPAVEFIDTRVLPYRMTLRTWQPGDVFKPLGMKGTMKVSDYLTNSKISFFNRQNILVLSAAMPEGEAIVWLCGLRLSEEFRLPPDARKALRLEFRRPKGIVLGAPAHEG